MARLANDFEIRMIRRDVDSDNYMDWLTLREKTKCEEGKLCYCGHTYKCSCCDPDKKMFEESVERGTVILGDPDNGWKTFIE